MASIETLKRASEQFPFYKNFFDRCIEELENKGSQSSMVESFVDLLNKTYNGEKFSGSVLEIIVAYRNRLKFNGFNIK